MIRIRDRSSSHDRGDTGAPNNNTRPTRNDRAPVARAFLTSALPAMRALTYPPKALKRRPARDETAMKVEVSAKSLSSSTSLPAEVRSIPPMIEKMRKNRNVPPMSTMRPMTTAFMLISLSAVIKSHFLWVAPPHPSPFPAWLPNWLLGNLRHGENRP